MPVCAYFFSYCSIAWVINSTHYKDRNQVLIHTYTCIYWVVVLARIKLAFSTLVDIHYRVQLIVETSKLLVNVLVLAMVVNNLSSKEKAGFHFCKKFGNSG